MKDFIGISFILLLASCSDQIATDQPVSEKESMKVEESNLNSLITFESDTTYSFEIDAPAPDTFKLVSQNRFFFYCFGNFSSPGNLQDHFKIPFKINKEVTQLYKDSSDVTTLYRVVRDDDFIKFFYGTKEDGFENNEMALVSASITKPTFQITNGLKVGLTRTEVNNILFKDGAPENIGNYKNLLIATAADGIWVHFNFENDLLTKIKIDSDFQFNKE